MNVLIINCGSSSIKTALINSQTGVSLFDLKVEGLAKGKVSLKHSKSEEVVLCPHQDFEAVLQFTLEWIKTEVSEHTIHAVGHRVVHGGEAFDESVIIDKQVEETIQALFSLAPLHNPVNYQGIVAAKAVFADLQHVAVFDTAFHQTLPKRAKTYALPKELREKHQLRRYGFHGTSHEYVAQEAAQHLGEDIHNLRLITCHLGNGASVCAVEYGRSIETSMGMTPLEGLVMGTRSGDIDPGILMHIAREENMSIEELDRLLNKESGLKGLSGESNDMRTIERLASEGDEDARLALQLFTHRLRKYIGAYAAVMGGVDAIIFTGGIGENSAVVRHRSAQRLSFLGALINEDANLDVQVTAKEPVATFSMAHSRCQLLVVKTNEQLAIARETAQLVETNLEVNSVPTIPIAVSARHAHLSQDVLEQLFGKGYELNVRAPLSQPGQFAAEETIELIGPKNTIQKVRILGPCRSLTQIEISRTDEFFLGIDAPVRASGKIKNSAGIKIKGPKGSVVLEEGVICAWRHIHMTPEDAQIFGVEDKDIVEVQVGDESRPLTFGNVLVRVSPKYKLEMHIDTDEANAAELPRNSEGVLLATSSKAQLNKRKLKK